MQPIEFWKMSGSGNDFILIDNRKEDVKAEEMSRLVKRVCRRRESVGADGAIFVMRSQEYDFKWRFFNADGGEAEMCGNGTRCVSRFAFLKGIAGKRMTFESLAGPISSTVDDRNVKVQMPKPTHLTMDVDIKQQKGWKSIDYINTGVPHLVISIEDLSTYPVKKQGRYLRYHEHFSPDGTNVNFMAIMDSHLIEMRTYERGVEDETLACGTGAIACALTASVRGWVKSPVNVKTSGGELLGIYFETNDDRIEKVWLEGNTSIVFKGSLYPEAL